MPTDDDAPPPGEVEGSGPLASGPGPVSSANVVVERPPPGLLRGKVGAPAALIAVLGGLALCVSIAFYLRKSSLARAARTRS